jgi:hypothetical protein
MRSWPLWTLTYNRDYVFSQGPYGLDRSTNMCCCWLGCGYPQRGRQGGGKDGARVRAGGARGNERTRNPLKKGCMITEANWGGCVQPTNPLTTRECIGDKEIPKGDWQIKLVDFLGEY